MRITTPSSKGRIFPSPSITGGNIFSDGSDGLLDVNAAFEELTGIRVLYTTFATNEELYAKLKRGGTSYDIIIPSDYMVARMIAEDMVQPLNFENIPNVRFLDEQYLYTDFDPEGAYSVPYTWGTVGIIYNTQYVDEEDTHSWDILWDERYMGEILMFSNSRDSFAIALKRLGYSMNSTSEEELRDACESLKDQKMLVQAYVMDEIFDKMEGEEAMIAPYYAGDAITMADENPNLAFSIPDEGTNRFIDSICIPSNANKKRRRKCILTFSASRRSLRRISNLSAILHRTWPLMNCWMRICSRMKLHIPARRC